MSQISPPIRIALAGALLFLVIWFVALKPKPIEEDFSTAPAPAPATAAASAPGAAVRSAQTAQATASSDAQRGAGSAAEPDGAPAATAPAAGAAPATAGASGVAPAQPVAATPTDAALATLPASVQRALESRRVLVLLFWNSGRSADDRAVFRAVRGTDRHGGRVTVHVADIRLVSEYSPVTLGANVSQSPTVVVVDRNRKVETLTGYVDGGAVAQAVVDALRAR